MLDAVAPPTEPLRVLGEYLREQRRRAALSLRDVAKLTGISDSYLSQVERGLYSPSATVLKAIADALNLSAASLYTQAGLLEEHDHPGAPSVEAAVKADPDLSQAQKETLLHVYRTMVSGA